MTPLSEEKYQTAAEIAAAAAASSAVQGSQESVLSNRRSSRGDSSRSSIDENADRDVDSFLSRRRSSMRRLLHRATSRRRSSRMSMSSNKSSNSSIDVDRKRDENPSTFFSRSHSSVSNFMSRRRRSSLLSVDEQNIGSSEGDTDAKSSFTATGSRRRSAVNRNSSLDLIHSAQGQWRPRAEHPLLDPLLADQSSSEEKRPSPKNAFLRRVSLNGMHRMNSTGNLKQLLDKKMANDESPRSSFRKLSFFRRNSRRQSDSDQSANKRSSQLAHSFHGG